MTHKVTLTDEQYYWLLRRLNLDWDEEVNYQLSNSDTDTEYLEQLYSVYEAILGKANNFLEALSIADDLEEKKAELDEIRRYEQ